MRYNLTLIVLTVAGIVGTAIGYVDSRPTWDDTGITAAAVFLTAAVLAAMRPRFAWLVGILVGGPVLVFNLALQGGFGSAVALAIGLVGAGIGHVLGRALS